MKKKYNKKDNEIPDFLEDASAVSATECTGLIQIAADGREEWELYNQSVRFAPPQSGDAKEKNSFNGDTKAKNKG